MCPKVTVTLFAELSQISNLAAILTILIVITFTEVDFHDNAGWQFKQRAQHWLVRGKIWVLILFYQQQFIFCKNNINF